MIINKVAQSGIITIDLEQWMPKEEEIVIIDLKQYLFKELILKEKDFREQVSMIDSSIYKGKYVGIICSVDAIIPSWAYMLIATKLAEVEHLGMYHGDIDEIVRLQTLKKIESLDLTPYHDQRIVIKGCGDRKAIEGLYLSITERLLPVAKSIMYGEPCSTVPIYKKKKQVD